MLAPESVRRAVAAHGPFVAALYGGEIDEHDGWYLARNRHVDEPEWNHAGGLRLASESELDTMIDLARSALAAGGCPLALVADPFGTPAGLEKRMLARGWEECFRHSGLIWRGESLPSNGVGWPAGSTAEEIRAPAPTVGSRRPESSPAMDVFVSVFEEAFEEVAAGRLSTGYRSAFPESLRPRVEGVEVIHTLVRIDGEPAAIGSRALGFGVAGLYNLGVAPRFRRLGLGGAITLHRVAAARAEGADVVYLLTEDPRVEAAQLRRGFAKAFELVGLAEPFRTGGD